MDDSELRFKLLPKPDGSGATLQVEGLAPIEFSEAEVDLLMRQAGIVRALIREKFTEAPAVQAGCHGSPG